MTDLITSSYTVTGMTCGHCVASVTEELKELAGVQDVTVDLASGGVSTTSTEPLSDDAVRIGGRWYHGLVPAPRSASVA